MSNNIANVKQVTIGYNLLDTHPADSLREFQVTIDGQAQEYKDIVRTWADGRNEIVGRVSMRYELTTNSRVRSASQDQAAQIGAVPFNEFTGPWFNKATDNVMFNKKETQMHVLYAFNEPVEITKGDKIQLGYSIHNSVDGSTNLGGGMFTFRHACSNMFFMGLNGRGMSFDTRKILAYFGVKHSKTYTSDQIQGMLGKLTETGMVIVGAIRRMQDIDLTEVKAQKLVKELPEKDIKKLKWLDVDENGKVSMTKTIKEYEAWNDLTYQTSHTDIRLEDIMKRNRIIETQLLTPLLVSA